MSLLQSTGRALQTLGKKEPQDGVVATTETTDENGADVFQESMNDFIRSLRRVNVGMKRQILGLEEAGIIGLRKEDGAGTDSQGTAASQPPRLEPDGEGKIGGFDVGWLNSRNNQVEKELEAEVWGKIEMRLQDIVDKKVTIDPDVDNASGN